MSLHCEGGWTWTKLNEVRTKSEPQRRLRGSTWGPRASSKRLSIILSKQVGWGLGVSFLMFLGRTNLSATGSPQYRQSFLICKIWVLRDGVIFWCLESLDFCARSCCQWVSWLHDFLGKSPCEVKAPPTNAPVFSPFGLWTVVEISWSLPALSCMQVDVLVRMQCSSLDSGTNSMLEL